MHSLLICDGLAPDESFMGFLLRMANANHLHGMHWLYRHLQRQSVCRILLDDIPRVASLFGVSTNALEGRYIRPFGENRKISYLAHGQRISRQFLLRHLRPQLCPYCIVENGYSRAAWDFALVCACPFHKCALIDHCDNCYQRIRWSRPALLICGCGRALSEVPISNLGGSHPAVIVAKIVHNVLAPDDELQLVGWEAASAIFQRLELDTLFQLLWIFGIKQPTYLQGNMGVTKAKPTTGGAIKITEHAYARISDALSNDSSSPLDIAAHVHIPSLVWMLKELDGNEDRYLLAPLVERLQARSQLKKLGGVLPMKQLRLFD